jgi:hypothetical protein
MNIGFDHPSKNLGINGYAAISALAFVFGQPAKPIFLLQPISRAVETYSLAYSDFHRAGAGQVFGQRANMDA